MKNNSKETNRIKEPSNFAIKFANTVFVLGILFSVLIAVYAVYLINDRLGYSVTFYYSILLFSVIVAALLGFGLWKLRVELKVNMSIIFITTVISIYSFETYLDIKSKHEPIAKHMGGQYDKRTKLEVIEDLRKIFVKAYPNVHPQYFIHTNGLSTPNGKLFPLGGISNVTTVYCNESGYWSIFESDEHGFNNPVGSYNNKIDLVTVGDSFTEGACVNPDENVAAVLRKSRFNLINLGKGGNGSLLELATLKEYAEPLRPSVVLWLYFSNDLTDLKNELNSKILKKYLDNSDFSQNLIARQGEIDNVLVDYVENESARERNIDQDSDNRSGPEWWKMGRIINIIKLINIRYRLNIFPPPSGIFRKILNSAKIMVSGWNGRLYFVYLSTSYRENVLSTVTELDIPIIEIHREVFLPHPDPLSLFPFRDGESHYNAEGYRLIAETIVKRLDADGFIPSNSKN